MEKKEYITPTFTVVSFKIEHGYALSGYGPQNTFLGLIGLEQDIAEGYNAQGQQNWHQSETNYFGSNW